MSDYRVSTQDSDSVPYPVTWTKNGVAQDPTGYAVKFAFMTSETTAPASGDWKTGSWETDAATGAATPYIALTPVVGPLGTVPALAAGEQYWVWIQVTVSASVVKTIQVGTVTFTT